MVISFHAKVAFPPLTCKSSSPFDYAALAAECEQKPSRTYLEGFLYGYGFYLVLAKSAFSCISVVADYAALAAECVSCIILYLSLETRLISHPHAPYAQITFVRFRPVSQVQERMHLCIIGTF